MLTLRRHPRYGTHVGNAGDTADFRHQAAEVSKLQLGKIKIDSANRVDVDAAEIDPPQHQQIEQFTGQTKTVFTKDFKTHRSFHPKKANDG